jgi:signal transduction histidine kinase
VTGRTTRPVWPTATPPGAPEGLSWQLTDVAQLPRVRAEVRRHAAALARAEEPQSADLRDQLVLALDEMASNALRHGGGDPVRASVRLTAAGGAALHHRPVPEVTDTCR